MKLTHAVKKRAKAISRAVTMRYRNKQGLHFREYLFFAKKKKKNPLAHYSIIKAERQGHS